MNRSALLALSTLLLIVACASPPTYLETQRDLPPCGSLPNCVNSMSGQGGQTIEPLMATQNQWQKLIRFLEQKNDWSIEAKRENYVQAIAISPLLRFRDDIQLLYVPERNLIHVRSSSRLGISDMGVNRKRVELLRQILRENS